MVRRQESCSSYLLRPVGESCLKVSNVEAHGLQVLWNVHDSVLVEMWFTNNTQCSVGRLEIDMSGQNPAATSNRTSQSVRATTKNIRHLFSKRQVNTMHQLKELQ